MYKLQNTKTGNFYPKIFQNFDDAFIFRDTKLKPEQEYYNDCIIPIKKPTSHDWKIVK